MQEEIVEETVEWRHEDVVELGGSYVCHEASLGRESMREVWVMPSPDDMFELDVWKGLRSLILARRTVAQVVQPRDAMLTDSIGLDFTARLRGAHRSTPNFSVAQKLTEKVLRRSVPTPAEVC